MVSLHSNNIVTKHCEYLLFKYAPLLSPRLQLLQTFKLFSPDRSFPPSYPPKFMLFSLSQNKKKGKKEKKKQSNLLDLK